MMKRGTRQHKTIDQSHRNADINALRESAQHAAGLLAVNVQFVFDARVASGNHKRSAINRKANMADESFVENLINKVSIEDATFGQAFECCAFGYRKSVHGSRD